MRDSLLSLAGIVLVTAIGLSIYYESKPHYLQPASAPPQLKFQILPPVGTVVPADVAGFQTVPVPQGPDYQIRYRVETHDMQ